ncbi:hypothetical protein W911_04705 [Hyphomicrobium nitrativorans NL23]|uniref:Uncharacterized protein n=1 Tax=Hyphomicrobium nitrativorans NL23 TaxID=1029756 RepID=V5SJ37_9HYPH|nr:hypothetical protein W911_04705 [Hyphomicrobium nitrativorans NL23]
MKSVFVRKAKNLIGPVFSGPIKAAAETLARPEAATAAHKAVPHAGAEATQAWRILEARFGTVPTPDTQSRVQKNLSIARGDADRMAGLARRDGLSQARLLAHALDCYEAAYGGLEPEGG